MYIEKSSASISITVQISAVLAVMPSCSGENLHEHISTLPHKLQQTHRASNVCSIQLDMRQAELVQTADRYLEKPGTNWHIQSHFYTTSVYTTDVLVARRFSHRQQGPLWQRSYPLWRFELARVNQITHVGCMAGPIASSAFNRLSQYASDPGNRAYFMQNSPFLPQRWPRPMSVLIASTHGEMASKQHGLGGWLNTKMVYQWTITHPSTNRARCRATMLINTGWACYH